MKKIKKLVSCVSLMMIAVLSLTLMSACNNHERKDTEMIVENPVTSEIIKDRETITLKYDGNPKIFTPKVKCGSKYLEDVEIWMYINSAGYVDKYNYPIEIGDYEISFEFNFGGSRIDYEDYKPCDIEFYLKIVE